MASNFELGKVVEIRLPDNSFSYGLVLESPLVAFSNRTFKSRQTQFSDLFNDSIFIVWVMKYALGKKGWPKVGKLNSHKLFGRSHTFYKFDSINKSFSTYCNGIETPANLEDCVKLECAAVWDSLHVEDRIFANSKGEVCKWSKSLSAEEQV
ncbi:Imm26 family immunity protein [Alteromonas mediterranea]|mgnify:CR=1 FL=1|uniref:Uncharacterized protein n=1 Tax=Alteromonas mediterranea (strain DSM 17117 / CIP 110805 / LMG 28347 / Deep ecotype) TaxID=1774373 RepID=F2G892_ALTMD|nr:MULTISPECIES: Imm26 family immunity protein [Alteromonas]AEA96793.1 hypothetical protein MADE_1003225 [Alteromonas mediterranea DE]CAH1216322.1 hypothetical protein ISS312_04076 [Alteromonas mediterranea]